MIRESGGAFYLAFAVVLLISVAIVWWSTLRTKTAADYLIAGASIGPTQNALALAGDFVGVGGFFAITGLVALYGCDGFVFGLGAISGFPLMLFLFAGPLRRLGRYTLADVLAATLSSDRPRFLVALTQLVAVLAQFMAQLVGAMALLHLLFGIPPTVSLVLLGMVIGAYVLLGGMFATTWLQIVKCCLMMTVAAVIAGQVMMFFGLSLVRVLARAVEVGGPAMMMPGKLFSSSWDMLSLLLGLALGNASMPHILMRLNTVRTPADARQSVFRATGIIVVFHLLILLLGFAAASLVGRDAVLAADPGGNMALPLLARRVGGDPLLGSISAIALATILAVVAGLVMAGAAILSHDLWVPFQRARGREVDQLASARIASLLLIVLALGFAFLFRGQNLAFLSATGYAVAASANFPALVLGIFWRRFTPSGAFASLATGLGASLLLVSLSPIVMVGIFHGKAIFPLQNPALVSVPLAFAAGILATLMQARPQHRPNFA